jgi:hypothetical protein
VLVRKQLEAIVTESTIEIMHGGRRVASQPRSYVSDRKTTSSEHMNDAHRHYVKWSAANELEWAITVGINTHAFLKFVLSQTTHRDFGYRWSNSIKSLHRKFGDERLEAACNLALEIGVTKTASLHSTLNNNLDQHNRRDETLQEADFDHDNIRGASYYH